MESENEISTYLGQKGYTIYKNALEFDDHEYIRKQLTVKPYIPKSPVKPPSFPIYRENPNKFYIPKYFGIETYGEPDEVRLPEGIDINVEFKGKLRDYQIPIVDAYIKKTKSTIGGGGLLDIPCGYGKCHGIDTPILMYDGRITMVQDIKVGDLIMGDDSTPRTVLSLARGKEMLYDIISDYNESYTVNESHILSTRNIKTSKIYDISVTDYMKITNKYGEGSEPYVGYRNPVDFKWHNIPLDPFLVGMIIGYNDKLTKQHLSLLILQCKHTIITSIDTIYNTIMDLKLDLSVDMYIPENYKINTYGVRYWLMEGIIHINGRTIIGNEGLIDDVIFLARSLGYGAYKIAYNDDGSIYETIIIRNACSTSHRLSPFKIKKKQMGDYYGFTLDGNSRYMLGDLTVTHNTAMALNIISILNKKTLVIVHKGFLLDQWIERIKEFLPNARIGRIQGQIIDIEGKDIVIGMLQSLSMKSYPSELFTQFGLSIVDECHHISSEVFSRSLQAIVTKYTLGLSATMNRKDGLTNVFKMFLGDVVYSIKREAEDNVIVKSIEYVTTDDEFNKTIYDYRGNPAYSSMITKLCSYNRRTEFILEVIKKELKEKDNQQIMILGQNKSILNYLFKAIEHHNIATVGYYIGGMKEKELKLSETKKIIVATYAMAAEGLDIKSLTTLLLVTPRTDVVQAVGRILRVKHERPLVIDIVDSHKMFQNQWKKRKAFYKKNSYKILETNSHGYMKDDWIEFKKKKTKNKNLFNQCLL